MLDSCLRLEHHFSTGINVFFVIFPEAVDVCLLAIYGVLEALTSCGGLLWYAYPLDPDNQIL